MRRHIDWLHLVVWLTIMVFCIGFWVVTGAIFFSCESAPPPTRLSSGAIQLAGYDGAVETHWQLAELNYLEAHRLAEERGDRAMISKAAGNIGGIYLEHRRLAGAALWLERAIEADPNNREAITNLATALLLSARADTVALTRDEARARAVILYRWVLERYPNFAPAWGNLGVALLESGHVPQAIAAYEQSLQLDPHNMKVRANLELLKGAK